MDWNAIPVIWPSGLRRQLQALVRKGEGSNPSIINFFLIKLSKIINQSLVGQDALSHFQMFSLKEFTNISYLCFEREQMIYAR